MNASMNPARNLPRRRSFVSSDLLRGLSARSTSAATITHLPISRATSHCFPSRRGQSSQGVNLPSSRHESVVTAGCAPPTNVLCTRLFTARRGRRNSALSVLCSASMFSIWCGGRPHHHLTRAAFSAVGQACPYPLRVRNRPASHNSSHHRCRSLHSSSARMPLDSQSGSSRTGGLPPYVLCL